MRVGTLDDASAWSGATALRFDEPRPLSDLDLLIWDTAGLIRRYRRASGASDDTLSVADSESLLAFARHWRSAFRALLSRGGTVVVVLSPGTCFGVHTLHDVVGFDPLELLPHAIRQAPLRDPLDVHSSAGEPFASFFNRFPTAMIATSTLCADRGTPICNPMGDPAAAGLFHHEHPGQWLVLPSLRTTALRGSAASPGFDAYLEAITGLVAKLRGASGVVRVAEWARTPFWPEEREARVEHEQLMAEQARLEQRDRDLRSRLDSFEMARHLVAAAPPASGNAAAVLLGAMDVPTRMWTAAGDVLVSTLPDGSTAVATLCGPEGTDESPFELPDAALRNALSFAREEDEAVRAWLLYADDHERPPMLRTGPSGRLTDRADAIGVRVVTTMDLLHAYRTPERRSSLWTSILAAPVFAAAGLAR